MEKRISYLILGISLILSIVLPSCADKDEEFQNKPISFSELPKTAQEFCNEFFSYTAVKGCGQINDDGELIYEVEFEDGCEVVFDSVGIWQEVDAPEYKSIPDGIVPEVIQEYLDQYYSDYGVNEINKTGYGYNVELTGENAAELMFNQNGEIISQTGN